MTRKIEFPRVVMVGDNCLDDIGDISLEVSQGNNALIVADETTMKVAGNKVKEILEGKKFNVTTYMTKIASQDSVTEAQNLIKENKTKLVLGVGGGTCIDTAKLSSAYETIPFISVPTAATHDGIGSPIASIKTNGIFKSIDANAPIAIIADTKVISTAPPRFMAAGCGDLVSNYTAVEDWKLAHKLKGEVFGHYAAALSIMSARVILENSTTIKESPVGTKIVVEGLISSGAAMCITGNSRPCSGAEHLFSHALDKVSPTHALHGEQCGIGTIMMAYLHKLDWEHFRESLKIIGAPTTAKELGIAKEHIIEALTIAPTIRDRYTILSSNKLDEKSATELAEKTGVI